MQRFLFLVVAVLLGLRMSAAAAEAPLGRIGVYVQFQKESKSPDLLRQTMQRIKAAGIDFIHCSGKGHVVRWESKVAPASLVTDPSYMGAVVRSAHEAGLKVSPVFCAAIEGGESGPNALLQAHPSWAYRRRP